MSLGIIHMDVPAYPHYHFEYHSQSKVVYAVRLWTPLRVGDPIAHHVETHGAAVNAINTFFRGYKEHLNYGDVGQRQGEPHRLEST